MNAVQKVATSLGVEIDESDIDIVHRVRSQDKDKPNIVVRFATRSARDRVLSAAKKTQLNVGLLGFEGNQPLYVNEHLCIETKTLLTKAKQAKRDKGWKYVWVTQGKVLMRKTENSNVLHVTCEEDLTKVV